VNVRHDNQQGTQLVPMAPAQQVPPPSPGPFGAHPPESSDLFDYALLRDYGGFVLRAPLRHPLLALVCFLTMMSMAVVALKVLPKRYGAQGRILAQRNPVMWTLSNPNLSRPSDWDVPARAARETVLRRDNLVALCKQTDFVDRYLRTRAPAVLVRDWLVELVTRKKKNMDERLDDLVDTLESRLWVDVSAEGTVTITFEWSDRQLTYQMVEAALQNFLEVRHATEISVVGEAISILENHTDSLQQQIEVALAQLEAKERSMRKSAPPRRLFASRGRAPDSEDVGRLKVLLAAKQRALADLEEFRRRRLAELQTTLAQQQAIYADQHPALLGTRQAIEALSAPSPQIQTLRNEVQEMEREIVRRGGQLAAVPREIPTPVALNELATSSLNQDEDPKLEYERGQVRLLVRQYSNLLERIDAARMEMDTMQAAFKYRYSVLSPPQMPKKPLKPNAVALFVSGIVGGILFAFLVSAIVDLRSGIVLERWQIERRLGLPVLAEIK
jgi:uncharacterized protein involved in exopolysaccharide biosynthesis